MCIRDRAQAVMGAAREAFIEGASAAAWVGGGVLVVTALLVAWLTRRTPERFGSDERIGEPAVPE